MIVKRIPVGPMKNLDYLLMDEKSREAIAVDSGWETAPVVKAAKEGGMKVRFVVATHGHFDHVETLDELAAAFGAKVVAHEKSEVRADLRVKDGDVLPLGDGEVRVVYTPGHTQDSICLYDGKDLFTGDTLFIGNCGRTDLPGGSAEQLYHSLHDIILRLPPSTMVYPGHNYGDVPSRNLGDEAVLNPTLAARSLKEFLGVE